MLKITDCCLHSHAAPLPGHVSARAGDHAADPAGVLGHADKHVGEAGLGAARPEGGHTHQVPAAVLTVSNMIVYLFIYLSIFISTYLKLQNVYPAPAPTGHVGHLEVAL